MVYMKAKSLSYHRMGEPWGLRPEVPRFYLQHHMYGDKEREYEESGVIQVKSTLREGQNLWLNNRMSHHHKPQPTLLHIKKARRWLNVTWKDLWREFYRQMYSRPWPKGLWGWNAPQVLTQCQQEPEGDEVSHMSVQVQRAAIMNLWYEMQLICSSFKVQGVQQGGNEK